MNSFNFDSLKAAKDFKSDAFIVINSPRTKQPLKIPISDFFNVSTTLGLSAAASVDYGNVYFVAPEGGDETTAVKGNPNLPYTNVLNVIHTLAVSGDHVVIIGDYTIDGTYGTGMTDDASILKDGVDVTIIGNILSSVEEPMLFDDSGKTCIIDVTGSIQNTAGDPNVMGASHFWNIDINHNDSNITVKCANYLTESHIGRIGSGKLTCNTQLMRSNWSGQLMIGDPIGADGELTWNTDTYLVENDPTDWWFQLVAKNGLLRFRGDIINKDRGVNGSATGSIAAIETGTMDFVGNVYFPEDNTVFDGEQLMMWRASAKFFFTGNVVGIEGLFGCPYQTLLKIRSLTATAEGYFNFGKVRLTGRTAATPSVDFGAAIWDMGSNDVAARMHLHVEDLVVQNGICLADSNTGGVLKRVSGNMKTLEAHADADVVRVTGLSRILLQDATLIATHASAAAIGTTTSGTITVTRSVSGNRAVDGAVTQRVSTVLVDAFVQ